MLYKNCVEHWTVVRRSKKKENPFFFSIKKVFCVVVLYYAKQIPCYRASVK